MRDELYIGDDRQRQRCIFLGEKLRNAHMHIIGRSDTGKTTSIEHMIRQDIVRGGGCCVIDMLGNLYPRILNFITYYGLADRIVLFDPTDPEHCPGLNYFDTFGDSVDPGTVLDTAMDGLMRVYREQSESVKPRWETYAPLAFEPLIAAHFSMLEIVPFVSPAFDNFRRRLLADCGQFHLQHGWAEFDSKKNSAQKFELIEVVYNRGMRFWPHRRVRRIIGQTQNFVDWRHAMDGGKIVLCNLGQTKELTAKQTQMMGVILLHQIINAAKTRRPPEGEEYPRRFYVYIDEFAQILCRDFEMALDTLRNFGLSFILSHQRMDQLLRETQDINVASALMANARVKQVFNVSEQDSEPLAKEIFGPFIHADDIKYQHEHTLLVPHQELTHLHSSAHIDSSASSDSTPGYSYSDGIVYDLHHLRDERLSNTTSRADPTSSLTSGSSDSSVTSEALRTVYDREKEKEAPIFRNIEEKLWSFKREILRQRQRESLLSIPGHEPFRITSPEMKPYFVEKASIEEFIAGVHHDAGTLSPSQVDKLLEERYRQLLGEDFGEFWGGISRKDSEIPLIDSDDHWQ